MKKRTSNPVCERWKNRFRFIFLLYIHFILIRQTRDTCFSFFSNVKLNQKYLPGVPGIVTFIDKNIEPLIF